MRQIDPPELRRLPWEALYREPGGFVALSDLSISRYIAVGAQINRATNSAEIQRLQRWADSGQIVRPETQYDGVILFRDLTVFEVR